MTEWILVLVLAGAGAAFLAVPFLKPKAPEVLAPDIEKSATAPAVTPAPSRQGSFTAAAVALVMVAGGTGLYILTAPEQPATVPANLTLPSGADVQPQQQAKLPDVDTMIQRVVDRLKANPGNADDWRMLGWSYFETQHYPEAVDAYSHAVALQPKSVEYQSAYGEAQVLAAGGQVTPDAMKAFKLALTSAPDDERALHYTGLAKKTNGDVKGALADWLKALKNAKPESLWVPRLRAEIADTAKAAGIDISADLPPAPSLTPEQFAAAPTQAAQQVQSMSPQEQQAMIRNMVAGLDQRLAQNPRDRDGWIRLIRSRKVLNETDQAESALNRALAAFRDDPATQTELKTAALQLGIRLQ